MPLRSTTIRPATENTSGMRRLTRTMTSPRSRSSRIRLKTSATCRTLMAAVGSSDGLGVAESGTGNGACLTPASGHAAPQIARPRLALCSLNSSPAGAAWRRLAAVAPLPHKEPAEHPKQLKVVAEYRADAGMIHPLTVERGMTRRNGSVIHCHHQDRRGAFVDSSMHRGLSLMPAPASLPHPRRARRKGRHPLTRRGYYFGDRLPTGRGRLPS
jgi:hypothetical protein